MTAGAGEILGPWSSFFVIVGSAAAALTGLMFVVFTLISGGERAGGHREGTRAFSTPTVVHFAAALFVSAMLSAPWRSLLGPEVLLAGAGIFGIGYVARLIYHARNLTQYTPDVEDWAWYWALPLVAYGTLVAGAIMLVRIPGDALFSVALGAMLMIFIGIHNSWDIVTYLAGGKSSDES